MINGRLGVYATSMQLDQNWNKKEMLIREEDMQYYNDCVDNRTFIELSLNGSRFI